MQELLHHSQHKLQSMTEALWFSQSERRSLRLILLFSLGMQELLHHSQHELQNMTEALWSSQSEC